MKITYIIIEIQQQFYMNSDTSIVVVQINIITIRTEAKISRFKTSRQVSRYIYLFLIEKPLNATPVNLLNAA